MAFFEEIGKKLSSAGQGVAQSTKNFADVTRLNGVISEKEKRIAQLQAAIGEAYYNNHKDDPDAEEKQSIDEINTLKKEIQQHQDEIQQIRGVTKCPKCGADVAITAGFCNVCGTQMPRQTVAEPVGEEGTVCPNCHKAVAKGSAFCTNCGTKL